MANLTTTAYYTRKTIKFGLIGVVAFILLKNVFSFGLTAWRRLHPPPPPPPTVDFGILPNVQFPESPFKDKQLIYQLETVAGGTPNLGDRARVYFIPIRSPSLLDLDRASAIARRLGFYGQPIKVSDTIYQWQNAGLLTSVLEMDIVNNNFTLRKNWQQDQTILSEKMLPLDEQTVIEAKNFLQTAGLLTKELQTGQGKVSYWRFAPPTLVPVMSLSEADLVGVSLFRTNLDDLAILPPQPEEALVSLLISGSRSRDKRILEVNYTHFPVLEDTFGTYPLKTSAQAWQELKGGQAFIASLEENKSQITIRKIYLAYFESSLPQNYLQPVYVFEGNGDFIAYLAAVSSEWTK